MSDAGEASSQFEKSAPEDREVAGPLDESEANREIFNTTQGAKRLGSGVHDRAQLALQRAVDGLHQDHE